MASSLLFIALLPDEVIRKEVTQFKEYAATHFRSSRALRSPPHITLISPFRWPEERVGELHTILALFAAEEHPFQLGLDGFNRFPPRVIFVDVERKVELFGLQSRLEAYLEASLNLKNESHHAYNPHMTVAFKDLHRSVFPEAWAYFSQLKYERALLVDALALLQHNGRNWEVSRQFAFEKEGKAE
ncbi:MAG: 2'-5' RNA ligase family protein [Lewinellaceae bacterium]|nr:2'-5' RNA ligase family protein [Phaeodactylibacter sp.]MCB0613326.1 2'-5' RNA ligase family protein [Phaeodactylibacter sp.]MCB9351845.1 2'-5' RNA ligase family protein [Lewinellaceae bacterium]